MKEKQLKIQELKPDYSDPKVQAALENMTRFVKERREELEAGRRRAAILIPYFRNKRLLKS